MSNLINWQRIVELERAGVRPDVDPETFWDERAEDFAVGHARRESNGLAAAALAFLAPGPAESLLDLGSGAGTIALPFARAVRRVTAVDLSGKMLDGLAAQAAGAGIRNIRAVKGSFRDLPASRLRPHDLVVACRSIGLISSDLAGRFDMVDALERVNALANARVCLLFVSEAIGLDPDFLARFDPRERRRIHGGELGVFNLAHSLGYMPRLDYLAHPVDHAYEDPDEAFAVNRRFMDLDGRHRDRFIRYFRSKATKAKGEWRLTLPGRTRCIHWRRDTSWNAGLPNG